jgi:hypothetical protein
MSNANKLRLHATTAMVGLSSLILAMGAPWKFG